MADIPVTGFTGDGTSITYTSVNSGGDTVSNNGRVLLLFQNGSGSDYDITFTTTTTVDGEDVADKTVTVPANGDYVAGPFERQFYNNSNGKIDISYSGTTSLTVAAVQPNEFIPLNK